jgi:hypothetical protein
MSGAYSPHPSPQSIHGKIPLARQGEICEIGEKHKADLAARIFGTLIFDRR